jgi:hypothetical protein
MKAAKRVTPADFDQLRAEDCGLCLACGAIQYGCGPDARSYECEDCGEPQVYGIEEAFVMGSLAVDDAAEPVF